MQNNEHDEEFEKLIANETDAVKEIALYRFYLPPVTPSARVAPPERSRFVERGRGVRHRDNLRDVERAWELIHRFKNAHDREGQHD